MFLIKNLTLNRYCANNAGKNASAIIVTVSWVFVHYRGHERYDKTTFGIIWTELSLSLESHLFHWLSRVFSPFKQGDF